MMGSEKNIPESEIILGTYNTIIDPDAWMPLLDRYSQCLDDICFQM